MGIGIVEIITLLMGLAGFSVGTNPNAPTGDQALQYAMSDADIVVHFDAGSVIPNNYKVLKNLQNQPQIKASPELAKAVRKMVAEVDGPRGLAQQMVGVDLTTDVSDATAFIKINKGSDPNVLVSVHGKFKIDTVDKIGKMSGGSAAVKVAGGAWVDAGDGMAVAVTKNGMLLAGTTSLIKDRMVDNYKATAFSNPGMANVKELLDQKPVFAVALAMSQPARSEALAKHGGDQNFLTDIIKRHKFAAFAVFKDGAGWWWVDSSKAGLDSMQQVSDGVIDVLRAAQVAPRGFAKIALGALDSYRGKSKQIDDLIRHKKDIWKIVDTYSGDGQFKAASSADPKSLKLSVRLTGRSLSEVLPVGVFVPAVAFTLLEKSGSPSMQQMPSPTPLPPPPPPAKKGNPPKRP
jgi:hypothetical protein